MWRALGNASMRAAPMSSVSSPSSARALKSQRAGVRRVAFLQIEWGGVDAGGRFADPCSRGANCEGLCQFLTATGVSLLTRGQPQHDVIDTKPSQVYPCLRGANRLISLMASGRRGISLLARGQLEEKIVVGKRLRYIPAYAGPTGHNRGTILPTTGISLLTRGQRP